jgi:hypothetical protein
VKWNRSPSHLTVRRTTVDERDTTRDVIGRFLLGAASEEERQQVETRLFAEDEFLAELQDREDALVDDYAHGRLQGDDRTAFERRFLASSQGRDRVAFARAAARVKPGASVRGRVPAWLPTVAAAVFATAAIGLGVRSAQLGDALRRDHARALAREQELTRALESARQPASEPSAPPALLLRAYGTRDQGETPELKARPLGPVAIAAPLPSGARHASYQAVLRTAEGALAWEDAGLLADGATVRVTIPAAALAPGDYILTLSGRGRTGRAVELEDYYFRVVP